MSDLREKSGIGDPSESLGDVQARRYLDLVTEARGSDKYSDMIVTDGFYDDESIRVAVKRNPGLAEQYYDWVVANRNLTSVLYLFEAAPIHAEYLRPVFDGRPRLLATYANFNFRGVTKEQRHSDEPLSTVLGATRLTMSAELSVVQKHIKEVQEWERVIGAKLGQKEWLEIKNLFGGVVTVRLNRIDNPNPETSGIMITILPTDKTAYDFVSERFNLTKAGLIDSGTHWKDHMNFGYMTRKGKVDERKLIESLVTYDWESSELTVSLEEACGTIADEFY